MTGPYPAGDPAPSALTRADRVLVAATTAFLFLAPAAASTGWRLIALAFAGFAILAAGPSRLAEDLRALPRGVMLAFAAWAAIAAASYFWSDAPHYTLAEIKTEVGYGLLAFAVFLVAGHRLDRWQLWRKTLFIGAVCIFLVAFAQEHIPVHINRRSMDGGPGPWSTHLVMIAPLLLAISWPRPWGEARPGGWTLAALALLALAAWRSENRIVWVALAVQLVLAATLVSGRPWVPAAMSARIRSVLLVAAGSVLLVFVASIVERSEKLFGQRAASSESIEHDLRPHLWSVAIDEVRKAPWLGHGFGREIRGTQFLSVTPDDGHPATRHSHNLFTDMAVQLGVVGFAAFVLVLVLLALEYRRYLRDARLAPWGVVGIALLAGFVAKNLTDDFLYRHNALVFWALNAMIVGSARRAARNAG